MKRGKGESNRLAKHKRGGGTIQTRSERGKIPTVQEMGWKRREMEADE